MKGILMVMLTLAFPLLLGASAPYAVTGTDAMGISSSSQPLLLAVAEEYRRVEQDLSYRLETAFVDHNLGTPRTWPAMAEGYLAYFMGRSLGS